MGLSPQSLAALTRGIVVRRPGPGQMRALCRLGVGLRWVAITFASLTVLMAPRAPRVLLAEIVAAMVYNGLVLLAVMRAEDRSLPTIALLTTVIDLLFCFAFIGLNNTVPGSQQVAAYLPGTIEAVAFFGIAGAVLSVSLFSAGVLLVQATSFVFWSSSFDGLGAFESIMIVVLMAACLAGVHEILMSPPRDAVESGDGVVDLHGSSMRLSARDHEILRLVGQGRSNAQIAAELGISERMVKKSLERLLSLLRARNRTEAVATASRLRLL